jgi:hypothetical protein
MSEPYDWARELYGAPNFTFRAAHLRLRERPPSRQAGGALPGSGAKTRNDYTELHIHVYVNSSLELQLSRHDLTVFCEKVSWRNSV